MGFNYYRKATIITFIDFATNTVGLGLLRVATGATVVPAFKKVWLERYPRPSVFHTDQGKQYTSLELLRFCDSLGIRKTFSSVYNPTSNSLSERINWGLAVGLRVLKGSEIKEVLP